MKSLKGLKFLVFGILVMLISCTGQQKKKNAQREFCRDLTSFNNALDDLDEAYEGTDVDAFNRTYDKADRAWNKLEESAENLEDVEIEESQKAYNKLVDKINKIAKDKRLSDEDAAYQINQRIDAVADEINDLLTTECK